MQRQSTCSTQPSSVPTFRAHVRATPYTGIHTVFDCHVRKTDISSGSTALANSFLCCTIVSYQTLAFTPSHRWQLDAAAAKVKLPLARQVSLREDRYGMLALLPRPSAHCRSSMNRPRQRMGSCSSTNPEPQCSVLRCYIYREAPCSATFATTFLYCMVRP
jgi:hypothetical protein